MICVTYVYGLPTQIIIGMISLFHQLTELTRAYNNWDDLSHPLSWLTDTDNNWDDLSDNSDNRDELSISSSVYLRW